jgi:hypothetical protein
MYGSIAADPNEGRLIRMGWGEMFRFFKKKKKKESFFLRAC